MPVFANRYYPDNDVRRLSTGSFEQLTARIDEAVQRDTVRLFGEKVSSEVGATFPDHALVFSEDGRVLDVRFEDVGGSIKITSFSAPKTEAFASTDSRRTHLRTEAEQTASLFVSGSLTEAKVKLRQLLPLVDAKESHHDDQMVSSMIAFRRADRLWKTFFAEKANEIKRLTLSEAEQTQKNRIQAKFRSLYDGTVDTVGLNKFSDLVDTAIKQLGDRVESLRTRLTQSVSTVAVTESSDPSVTALSAFGSDLAEDLALVGRTLTQAQQRISRTDCLGRLHDALASDLVNQEIASQFVIKTAQRLVGAA